MLILDNICQSYRTEEVETRALDGVSLRIEPGEFLAIMGPSGCGKSTLLNILGLLDSPTSGSFLFNGEEVAKYSEKQLTRLRRAHIGFVFQSFNLIEDLTVAENVEVALIYRGVSAAERKRRVAEALERGQDQPPRQAPAATTVGRPATARGHRPRGRGPAQADPGRRAPPAISTTVNGDAVMALLTEVAESGTTVVMVTHSLAHAALVQRTVKLLDGRVVSETVMGI